MWLVLLLLVNFVNSFLIVDRSIESLSETKIFEAQRVELAVGIATNVTYFLMNTS